MSHRHHERSSSRMASDRPGPLAAFWNSFWEPPELSCPKCGCAITEYYDPFFFAPMRTLKGRRRIRCTSCNFIWRPSRHGRSIWDRFRSAGL